MPVFEIPDWVYAKGKPFTQEGHLVFQPADEDWQFLHSYGATRGVGNFASIDPLSPAILGYDTPPREEIKLDGIDIDHREIAVSYKIFDLPGMGKRGGRGSLLNLQNVRYVLIADTDRPIERYYKNIVAYATGADIADPRDIELYYNELSSNHPGGPKPPVKMREGAVPSSYDPRQDKNPCLDYLAYAWDQGKLMACTVWEKDGWASNGLGDDLDLKAVREHHRPRSLQNDPKHPTIVIKADSPEWKEAHKKWVNGGNPTDSKEWGRGVHLMYERAVSRGRRFYLPRRKGLKAREAKWLWPAYHSIAIFFGKKPPAEILSMIKSRIKKWCQDIFYLHPDNEKHMNPHASFVGWKWPAIKVTFKFQENAVSKVYANFDD